MDHIEVSDWVAHKYGRLVVYAKALGGGEERVKVPVNGVEYHGKCAGDHATFLASVLDEVATKLAKYEVREEIERRRKMKRDATP